MYQVLDNNSHSGTSRIGGCFSGFDPALFPENTPRNSALWKWDLVSESPTGGGVECACLLAFAYSDHN